MTCNPDVTIQQANFGYSTPKSLIVSSFKRPSLSKRLNNDKI